MKDIIILQHEPLTNRIKKIFCIEEIINAGFNFEYWDISQICNPGIKLPEQIECDYIRHFDKIKELKESINALNKSKILFIVEIFFSYENCKIWKILKQSGITILKFERYGNTTLSSQNNLKTLIKKIVSKGFLTKLYKKSFFLIYKRIYNLKKYDYLVTSTDCSCNCKVNHPDYDLYLEHKNDKPFLNYKYIVFVDCGFGKHPDELYFKGQIKKNNNKIWQEKLCAFFNYIEKKYCLPVVIAVHPKLHYEDNEFGGRKKIKNETLNLISNADFVLQDISNSLSFSILNNKSIGFIITNEFFKTYGSYMNSLVSNLETNYFVIDNNDFDKFEFITFSEKIRNRYIYSYLTDKSTENKKTEQILTDYLQTL